MLVLKVYTQEVSTSCSFFGYKIISMKFLKQTTKTMKTNSTNNGYDYLVYSAIVLIAVGIYITWQLTRH